MLLIFVECSEEMGAMDRVIECHCNQTQTNVAETLMQLLVATCDVLCRMMNCVPDSINKHDRLVGLQCTMVGNGVFS